MNTSSTDPIASFLQCHPKALIWLMYLMIGIDYFYNAHLLSGNIFASTSTNYYIYQIDAFFHGHINVNSPNTYDLSRYHNKWYLYWGWAPILFLWPFYLLWRLHASDICFTLLGGLMNVFLSNLCVQEVKRYFNISLSLQDEVFLLISFAFASPNFVLSLTGQIWFTSQIFATTFLLLFYSFFFRYLNRGKPYQIVLGILFFYLACLSRYSLIFNGLLLAYLYWDRRVTKKKMSRRLLCCIGVMSFFFICFGATSNYLKFQNIFEVGLRYVQGAPRYVAIEKSGNLLSLSYVWHNFYYCFLSPVSFSLEKRSIQFNPEGNSVLIFYPSLLLCLALFFKYKQFDSSKRFFVWVVIVAAFITIMGLMIYFSDGWYQFGYRYFFDAYPLFFLLLVLVIQYIPENIQWIIIIWGIGINFLVLLR